MAKAHWIENVEGGQDTGSVDQKHPFMVGSLFWVIQSISEICGMYNLTQPESITQVAVLKTGPDHLQQHTMCALSKSSWSRNLLRFLWCVDPFRVEQRQCWRDFLSSNRVDGYDRAIGFLSKSFAKVNQEMGSFDISSHWLPTEKSAEMLQIC